MDFIAAFTESLLSHWSTLIAKIQVLEEEGAESEAAQLMLNGHQLDLAAVVFTARYGGAVALDPAALSAVLCSTQTMDAALSKGQVVYGVNTGFGGSADTRTQAIEELQREVIRGLHYGIILDPECPFHSRSQIQSQISKNQWAETALSLDSDTLSMTSMPESWVRAAMLIRLNSLVGGASGIRLETVHTLAKLVNRNIVPRIPLRGSISASGDLSPLSYIAGLVQGKPSLTAWVGAYTVGRVRKVVNARRALVEADISPVILGAKEGLAIVNGTAMSSGVAALALHEVLCQAALAQILTAMTVEALCGTNESFDPFIAAVRPHPGQVDSSKNIFAFLATSKLVFHNDGSEESSLRQDRYSIRTASQWIGPVLEDLGLACSQIHTELNSVTDNPLIDVATSRIIHGGNFQARVITSAMEKTRQGCQTLGRMLFAQCTELINPATNRGLPPNLVVDEPNESFLWKGTDILIAALQSELGFLANPVGSHVMTAEMGNQSINSLALISARYTLTSVDILTQLSAAHLVALCQALDLRAMHAYFLEGFEPEFADITSEAFSTILPDRKEVGDLHDKLLSAFKKGLDSSTSLNSATRFISTLESLQPLILKNTPSSLETLVAMQSWTLHCAERALDLFISTRDEYITHPDAAPLLGKASKTMYVYLRQTLGIPFIREDSLRTPPLDVDVDGNDRESATMGGYIGIVYQAMKRGALYAVMMETFKGL